MSYLGVCSPMMMDGVRGSGQLYVFDDGWVLLGVELDASTRARLGEAILMQGGAVGGLVSGVKRERALKKVRGGIETEADRLTAREAGERFGPGIVTPLESVTSARLRKQRFGGRLLYVATDGGGGEQILMFGRKSAAFELLPPLLGDRWIDELDG